MTTLIADSGSTKTDWELVDDAGQILFTGKTQGINPFHLSDDDIWKFLPRNSLYPKYRHVCSFMVAVLPNL